MNSVLRKDPPVLSIGESDIHSLVRNVHVFLACRRFMSLLRISPILNQTYLACIIERCLWMIADPSNRAVCGRRLPGIAVSNPTGGHGCLFLVNVVCCQVEVSASG